MAKQIINPPGLGQPPGFAPAVRAGNTVYVSGQVARDQDGQVVGVGDFAAQADFVYQKIQTILEAAGASITDIVKMTSYVTDAANILKLRDIRQKYFGDHLAASTGVAVSGLAHPDFLIEIEVVAVVD